jgi:hypothetical protein
LRNSGIFLFQSRTSGNFYNLNCSLLKQQKIYWKHRGQIKWATLGDASTKFFHANATIKFRRNLITCLEDNAGVPFFIINGRLI